MEHVHVKGFRCSDNVPEGFTLYTPGYLAKQGTVHSGHWDNLKLETTTYRYWLSRAKPGDGEIWQVHVDRKEQGDWKRFVSYRESPTRCIHDDCRVPAPLGASCGNHESDKVTA